MKRIAATITFALVFLVAVTIQVAQANPYHRVPVYRDVLPPEGAQAPIIVIHAPQNGSYYPKNVSLTFDVITPKIGNASYSYVVLSELYYTSSWKPREITQIKRNYENNSYCIDLSAVWGGNISLTICAVGVSYIETGSEVVDSIWRYTYYDRFEMASSSTVYFTKDVVAPWISVMSPLNTTYKSPDVKLAFTVNEDFSQILYSLDDQGNQTISGNSTLTGLPNGEHSLNLYVFDLAGNISPKTLVFDVNSPEPFPIATAAAVVISLIALCAGLLVYFKKRQNLKSGSAL